MSRVKSLITAGLLGATLTLASIGGGAAGGFQANANDNNAANSDNCVAVYSAPHRGNGHLIRDRAAHGVRGAEIKALQDSCAGNGGE